MVRISWRGGNGPTRPRCRPRRGFRRRTGVLDALDTARGTSEPWRVVAIYVYIEPTRALIAVDVNTGSDSVSGSGHQSQFCLRQSLPRALRVRGLGGQITLDLAPMPKKDRKGFESALRAAFKSDPDRDDSGRLDPAGSFRTATQTRSYCPLAEILK